MAQDLNYPMTITKDTNHSFLVTFPDVPEAVTFGDTLEDALFHAVDALEAALEFYPETGKNIPKPSAAKGRPTVSPSPNFAAKLLLYQLTKEKKVPKAELARRLGWKYPQVDRLFNLRHNSHIGQISAAFAAVGAQMVIGIQPVAR